MKMKKWTEKRMRANRLPQDPLNFRVTGNLQWSIMLAFSFDECITNHQQLFHDSSIQRNTHIKDHHLLAPRNSHSFSIFLDPSLLKKIIVTIINHLNDV